MNAFSDLGVEGLMATCYPQKPWQHYNDLISRFERVAEGQTIAHDLLQADDGHLEHHPRQHHQHGHGHGNSPAHEQGHGHGQSQTQDLIAHNVLHSPIGTHVNGHGGHGVHGGLWKLQSPFGHDVRDDASTGVGAGEACDGRRDSHVGISVNGANGNGHDIMQMIEREREGWAVGP